MLALALMKGPPSPKKFQRHMWSSLLTIIYNHPPAESEDDPAVAGVTNHILRIMHEVHPGMRLVEFFPSMKYIPNWCVHCFLIVFYSLLIMEYRLAKWKGDAQYWFIQDTRRNERLFSPVVDDFVRVTLQCSTNNIDDRYQYQAQGIDRPCFASTLLKNQDKCSLSGREQAWLLGDIVYVL